MIIRKLIPRRQEAFWLLMMLVGIAIAVLGVIDLIKIEP
jgi:predicted nucleic acid-binding Zn ribbon protein